MKAIGVALAKGAGKGSGDYGLAAAKGNTDAAQWLLDHGANVNAADKVRAAARAPKRERERRPASFRCSARAR